MALSEDDGKTENILAVSTEDGRILFYFTGSGTDAETTDPSSKQRIPLCVAIGQIGGAAEGLTGRIKDFEIIKPPESRSLLVVTGSSDGAIRLWLLDEAELTDGKSVSITSLRDEEGDLPIGMSNGSSNDAKDVMAANGAVAQFGATTQVGTLLGTYEAGNRITCLKAFIMSESDSFRGDTTTNGLNGHFADT